MRRRGLAGALPAALAVLALALPEAAIAAPATPPKPLPKVGTSKPRASTPPPPRSAAPPAPRSAAPPPPGGAATAPPAERIEPVESGPPVDLAETWGYARSGAPRPRYVRRSSDPVFFAPNPVGYYSGVSVVGNQTPPHPAKKLGAKPAVLTWTGFERTSTGSRVFVQLSADPEYTVSQKGSVVTIRLRRTAINVRNNSRRLDLSYFKTPVRSARVRRKGKDTILTIVLKGDGQAEVGLIDGRAGSGYRLLVVDFTHGRAAPVAVDVP